MILSFFVEIFCFLCGLSHNPTWKLFFISRKFDFQSWKLFFLTWKFFFQSRRRNFLTRKLFFRSRKLFFLTWKFFFQSRIRNFLTRRLNFQLGEGIFLDLCYKKYAVFDNLSFRTSFRNLFNQGRCLNELSMTIVSSILFKTFPILDTFLKNCLIMIKVGGKNETL